MTHAPVRACARRSPPSPAHGAALKNTGPLRCGNLHDVKATRSQLHGRRSSHSCATVLGAAAFAVAPMQCSRPVTTPGASRGNTRVKLTPCAPPVVGLLLQTSHPARSLAPPTTPCLTHLPPHTARRRVAGARSNEWRQKRWDRSRCMPGDDEAEMEAACIPSDGVGAGCQLTRGVHFLPSLVLAGRERWALSRPQHERGLRV